MDRIAFREYGEFLVVYSAFSRNYLLIQDIYSDFFRGLYIKNESEEEVAKAISEEYEVDILIVKQDITKFCTELHDTIYSNSAPVSNPNTRGVAVQQIFDIMAQSLIPFSATIEITDYCNLRCVHCYRGERVASYWTHHSFEQALIELKELGTLNLTITGGEPFSHSMICDFLELTRKYGFVVSIQSNLLLLNDKVLSVLKKNIISDISVSLYSMADLEHDRITQSQGSAKITKENINRLIDNNIPVSINCPIMIYNQNAMPAMREFANQTGIDVKFALKIIPSQDKSLHIEDYNVFNTNFILDAIQNPKISLYKKELENIRQSKPSSRYCQTGFRSITLDAQGNMLICNAYRKKCGSLHDTSMKILWKESTNLNIWRNQTSFVIQKCLACPAYSYCEPCPAHAFTQSGNESDIDEITCQFGKAFYAADMAYIRKDGEIE